MARRTPPRDRIYNKPFFYLYDTWNEYKKRREEEKDRLRRDEARRRRELEEYRKLQNKMWEETRKHIYELKTPQEKLERRERIDRILRTEDKQNRSFLFREVSPALKAKYAGKRKTKRKGKSHATF